MIHHKKKGRSGNKSSISNLKPLAHSINKKISGLNKFYQDLGVITYLCGKSPYHQKFTSGHILAYFVPALKLGQFKIYYKNMNPVAVVSWAFLSDEVSELFAKGEYVLNMDDFNCGKNVWLTDFVVAGDNQNIREEVIRDLKEDVFSDKKVSALVRNSDGTVKKIFTSVGDKFNESIIN